MKKIVICVMAVISMLVMQTMCLAEESGEGWILDDNGVLTITMTDVEYGGWTRSDVTSIVIEEGAVSVAYGSFRNMSNVINISIPASMENIEESFRTCTKIQEINVAEGNKVYSSYDGMLMNADKSELIDYPQGKTSTELILPDTVQSMSPIRSKYLKKITLPRLLKSRGSFNYCTALEEICVDKENENYTAVDGILYNKDMTKLCAYPMKKEDTSYTFPQSVNSIGGMAFAGVTALKCMDIPSTITDIGDSVFYNGGVESVSFPDGIVTIGEDMFNGCYKLESVSIPDSVEVIGSYAFAECTALEDISLPSSLKEIGEYAFYTCRGLQTIHIPSSVTTIGSGAFDRCIWLQNVTLSSNMTEIPSECFYDCRSLTRLNVPEGIEKIGTDSFFGTELEVLYLPNSITYISDLSGVYAEYIYYNGTQAEWDNVEGWLSNKTEVVCVPKSMVVGAGVSKSDNDYVVTVQLKNVAASDVLIAAAYDRNGCLIDVVSEQLTAGAETHAFTIECDTQPEIKLFVWNSLGGLMPQCNVKTASFAI